MPSEVTIILDNFSLENIFLMRFNFFIYILNPLVIFKSVNYSWGNLFLQRVEMQENTDFILNYFLRKQNSFESLVSDSGFRRLVRCSFYTDYKKEAPEYLLDPQTIRMERLKLGGGDC